MILSTASSLIQGGHMMTFQKSQFKMTVPSSMQ